MPSTASFHRPGSHERGRRPFIALAASILLHGGLLTIAVNHHRATPPAPMPLEDKRVRIDVSLRPSGLPDHAASIKTAKEQQEISPATHRETRRETRHKKHVAPAAVAPTAHHNAAPKNTDLQAMPDPGGEPSAVEPSTGRDAASPVPSVDLAAAMNTARQFASEPRPGTPRSGISTDKPPQDWTSELGARIAKAERPDCRTAYEHRIEISKDFYIKPQGILLAAYILKGTLTDSGCKW